MREALEEMVYQFGYRGIMNNKPVITTGGLSSLELAFEKLGWDDPHVIPEQGNTCEILGCLKEITSGMKWDNLYLSLCSFHTEMAFNKRLRPEVKEYAIKRELKRDIVTGFLK